MKSKILSVFTFTLFAMFVSLTLVSAASLTIPTSSIVTPTSVNQDDGTFDITFDLTNTGLAADLDVDESTADQTSASATFSISPTSIADGSSTTVTKKMTVTVDFDDTYTGTLSGTIVVDPTGVGDSKEFDFSLTIEESDELDLCKAGVPEGDLEVRISDIKVITPEHSAAFGDDDDYWYMFDEIEVEIEVENTNNDEDIDNVEVEWGLWSDKLNEWVIDLDEEEDFDLSDDEEETFTFRFKIDDDMDVDLEDLEKGDLTLVVVANGEQQDGKTEFSVCASDQEDVELIIDDDFVILYDIKVPEAVNAGQVLEVSSDVWNIGDDDQEDVSVRIRVDSLNIIRDVEIGDIDSLENEVMRFDLEIPSNAKTGKHTMRFEVLDEDGDVFENDEDDESLFFATFNVNGGTASNEGSSSVDITASLDSQAMAGEDLIVRATITNTGDESTTYQILATGYNDWATLGGIQPRSLTLAAGASEDSTITLVPNKGVSGNQEFIIQVVYNGIITEQRINVPIQGSRSGLTGFAIGDSISDNWFIWLIALINIVLVILIIVVAVRMANK